MSASKEHVEAASAGLETYIPGLRHYFSKRVATDEVEDLIQEVFLRMQAHKGGSPIEHPARYLFTVAASVFTDRARRRIVRHVAEHESLQELHFPTEELTPERVLLGREALEVVVEAIADLPPRTRDVFVLHRFEEMSCASIASQLGLSISAVEKHIMKALRVLHARIEVD
jgi:RNA polymerase sigma factor (sigma-70 family)